MTYDELIEQAEKHYNAHEYQRAIELDKTKSDGYFWRGASYAALFDTENAMKDAETLLTIVPCAALHRGFAYNVKGNYKEAVDACTKALKEDVNAIMAYRCRARAYLNKKDYTSAIADYNKIIEIDPQSAFTYSGLGDVYRDQKQFDIAIENYTKAIGIDEKDPDAYNDRGVAYFRIRNFNLAKEDFTKAIENNEKHVFAYLYRGCSLNKTRNFASAIADFNKVLEIDPNNADAYLYRGYSLSRTRNFVSAIADFNKVLEIDPNNADAYLYRGYSLSRTRNFVSAIADFNKVLEIDQYFALAYFGRGIVYFQQKDYSLKAMKAYAEALEFFPDKEFFIAGFLKSIEHNGNDINNEVKKQFQESSNDLVNFVGEVLLTIKEWNDYHKYIRLIREVYNLLEQLEKEIDKKKANGIFYQYVKENSFAKEIGETRVLWLTPACYQNDPDEGKYIFKFFHSQFKTEPLTNLFKELIDGENTDIGYPIAFIRSFSECKDDLLMWDSSYGGNGAGVSLGVPFCKLAKAMKRPEHRELKNIDESAMLLPRQ